jgi:Arc/MetJ family transcription regulator
MMYTRCMKKRTNIYLDDEDKKAIAIIKVYYGLDSDASVVRFVLRKIARELQERVSGKTCQHRQD